jgi:hypothetical protein
MFGAGLVSTTAQPAPVQAYPTKPIRIVVPYATGGGTDTIARIVGAGLQERLKQPAVIDKQFAALVRFKKRARLEFRIHRKFYSSLAPFFDATVNAHIFVIRD